VTNLFENLPLKSFDAVKRGNLKKKTRKGDLENVQDARFGKIQHILSHATKPYGGPLMKQS
jgi:hypothetical protein